MMERKRFDMVEGIVGNGDIASILEPRDGFLYFASGVSNSQEERESEYQRERDLLLSQEKESRLVYFSSLRVLQPKTDRYTRHKREMERLVKDNFPKYCILRVGNIDWGDNPHTLINTLRNNVAEGKPVEIRNVERYVVDKDEFRHWLDMIPNDLNCEISIPGRRMRVKEIFKEYV